jgi:SAM-dependent methyltransferase
VPKEALALTATKPYRCGACGSTVSCSAGIWRFLPEQRAERYKDFLSEYQTVRADEGWGSSTADYYRALPSVARGDRNSAIWRIRAKSFRALINRVVEPYEARFAKPLKILDLGAGSCWLSYRLSERGHNVAAVDVSTDSLDGLGAHERYGHVNSFLPVQAEFDHLPFADKQADLVVFNASLHYSADCAATLIEGARVLDPGGCLVVMDTPVYHDGSSGARMVQERESAFLDRYGFRSNTLPAENFLTTRRLNELAADVGVRWEVVVPFYGVAWLVRPWKARLRRRREPARLPLIIGRFVPGKAGYADAFAG